VKLGRLLLAAALAARSVYSIHNDPAYLMELPRLPYGVTPPTLWSYPAYLMELPSIHNDPAYPAYTMTPPTQHTQLPRLLMEGILD
jgi:hypothetical protein